LSFIWRIKQSPFNNDYVATGSGDGKVKIWNSFNWTLIRTYSQHSSVVYALEWLDKDTVASGGYIETTIKIWSISTGQTKQIINVQDSFWSLKLLNNKIHLAAGLYSGDIKIHNINDGTFVSSLTGHSNYVNDLVQISNEILVSSCGADHTLRIWNLTTNTCKFVLIGHTSNVFSLKQITPSILVSGSLDNTIKLWDITSGQLIRTLTGHSGWIRLTVDLLNSQTLVSGSSDQTIKLWNWSTGECLATIQTNSDINSLAVLNSVEGNRINLISMKPNYFGYK
jgi:WD40 repeat protein